VKGAKKEAAEAEDDLDLLTITAAV